MTIVPARTAGEYDLVRLLFREYQQELGVDLCFQGFENELAELPGRYATPFGDILLAMDSMGQPIGCVAFRPLEEGRCELKRLYVRANGRGMGAGGKLVAAALEGARLAGYRAILLDTLPQMQEAIRMYRKLGFREIPPYTCNPVEGALFLELAIA